MRKSPPPRILPGSINQLFRYGLDILLPNGCALSAEHVAARGLCSDCWLGATMESYARLLIPRGKAASVSALVLLRVL